MIPVLGLCLGKTLWCRKGTKDGKFLLCSIDFMLIWSLREFFFKLILLFLKHIWEPIWLWFSKSLISIFLMMLDLKPIKCFLPLMVLWWGLPHDIWIALSQTLFGISIGRVFNLTKSALSRWFLLLKVNMDHLLCQPLLLKFLILMGFRISLFLLHLDPISLCLQTTHLNLWCMWMLYWSRNSWNQTWFIAGVKTSHWFVSGFICILKGVLI